MPVVLGLDPAKSTGFAVMDCETGKLLDHGAWDLEPPDAKKVKGKARALLLGQRAEELTFRMSGALELYNVTDVAYEWVWFFKQGSTAQINGSLASAIQMFCSQRDLRISPIPFATVKKLATVDGGAKKPAMVAMANSVFGLKLRKSNKVDQDIADAIWVADAHRRVHYESDAADMFTEDLD